MVGNDVVDLGDAEVCNGPSHPRFDARVFSRAESAALAASGAPNRLRWLLWAAKEAAYKLGVKRTPDLVFSPRRFVVELDARLHGSVQHPGGIARVTLCSDGDAIHAIATAGEAPGVVADITTAECGADASQAVRGFARERIAEQLGVAPEELLMGRRGRVPTLRVSGSDANIDLSLSHHGRYLAFACDLEAATR